MFKKFVLSLLLLLMGISVKAEISQKNVNDIIDNYRKIIVLMSKDIQAKNENTEKNAVIGKILFHQNRDKLNQLETSLVSNFEQNKNQLEILLDILEYDDDLWDADKLVFLTLLDSYSNYLQDINNKSKKLRKLSKRLNNDIKVLQQIQASYDHELGDIFAQLGTRALKNRRQAWSKYIEFLKKNYSRKEIISKYDDTPLLPTSRGASKKKKKKNEYFGFELPNKTVVLTFDDGPHYKYTKKIFSTLKKYNIKPVFFHVGKNIGKFDKNGNIKLSKTAKISKQLFDYGAVLANHSKSHPLLTKLSASKIETEISDTSKFLQEITNQQTQLFRPPYGARNDFVLAKIKSQNLKSIMWNVDSMDWADPVPKSIAKRVMKDIEKKKRGIILFHDIQPQTVKALPLIIDELVKKKYKFAQWNGKKFTLSKTNTVTSVNNNSSLYRKSWAVVIGVNDYKFWPKLRYAVNDAKEIKNVLINKLAFKEENIFTLYNEKATAKNILSLLNDKLGDQHLVKKNDRVFIFYAGHGATRKLASGRELGYIIPVDAKSEGYYGQSISMTNISDISEGITAKHIFFVMDSCYSGLALTRSGNRSKPINYLRENSKRIARQILTAGGADQEVADGGPNGHSVFTWNLIQALTGKGDVNNDGYIMASELAAYISPVVSSVSLQTPTFGNLLGSGGGDFIFELEGGNKKLINFSDQLDEEELSLAKKIETLKKEIEAKRLRNIKLKKELAVYKKELVEENKVALVSQTPQNATPKKLNEQGLRYYKKKNYSKSLEYFRKAANIDPTYVEAINNTGFIYYKTNRNENAIIWFLKTVALDPKRTVVWLNLADAYFETEEYNLAEQAYNKYLEMVPNSKVATRVKKNISIIKNKSH